MGVQSAAITAALEAARLADAKGGDARAVVEVTDEDEEADTVGEITGWLQRRGSDIWASDFAAIGSR